MQTGEPLDIKILATDLDHFTDDDEAQRYHRTFAGDPATWVGSYRPNDEAADPESLRDWQLWYRIEEV